MIHYTITPSFISVLAQPPLFLRNTPDVKNFLTTSTPKDCNTFLTLITRLKGNYLHPLDLNDNCLSYQSTTFDPAITRYLFTYYNFPVIYRGQSGFGSLFFKEAITKHHIPSYDPQALAMMADNLLHWTSSHTATHLLEFIVHNNLPITPEGEFIAFKSITEDYLDHQTQSISNRPGKVISMEKCDVDPDPASKCSSGLHAGSADYVASFGPESKRIIAVVIHPEHVVAIPNNKKLRCSKYRVWKEIQPDKINLFQDDCGLLINPQPNKPMSYTKEPPH